MINDDLKSGGVYAVTGSGVLKTIDGQIKQTVNDLLAAGHSIGDLFVFAHQAPGYLYYAVTYYPKREDDEMPGYGVFSWYPENERWPEGSAGNSDAV